MAPPTNRESRHIRYNPTTYPLVPAPVALVQALVTDHATEERIARLLTDYPPDELRLMAAQFSELADLISDYARNRTRSDIERNRS